MECLPIYAGECPVRRPSAKDFPADEWRTPGDLGVFRKRRVCDLYLRIDRKPKGVLVECGEIVRHLYSLNSVYRVSLADKVLLIASIAFDVSIAQTLLALCFGAQLRYFQISGAKALIRFRSWRNRRYRGGILRPPCGWLSRIHGPNLLILAARLVIVGGKMCRRKAWSSGGELFLPILRCSTRMVLPRP